jgi:hypothetical protein
MLLKNWFKVNFCLKIDVNETHKNQDQNSLGQGQRINQNSTTNSGCSC